MLLIFFAAALLAIAGIGDSVVIEHELALPSKSMHQKHARSHHHAKKTPNFSDLQDFVMKIQNATIEFNRERKLAKKEKNRQASINFLSQLSTATSSISTYGDLHNLMIKIQMGTPPQTFYVAPSFFTADLWLIDSRCESSICKGTVRKHKQFRMLKSKTYQPDKDYAQVQTFMYFGHASKDRLTLSNDIVVNQSFALAYKVNSFLYPDFAPDGELGLLADNRLSDIPNAITPLQNIASFLDEKIFSIFVNQNAKTKSNADTNQTSVGSITFGGLNKKNCASNWMFTNTSANDYFAAEYLFRISGFRVGDTENHRRKYAMFLPHIPFAVVPKVAAEIIAEKYNATYYKNTHHLTLPCNANKKNNLPDLHLKLNDKDELVIPASKLIIDYPSFKLDKGTCLFGVIPSILFFSLAPSWYIGGGLIFDNYCVAYDYGNLRVGFAETTNH